MFTFHGLVDGREHLELWPLAVLFLVMGLASPYWMKSIDMSGPHRGTREIVEHHREHEARDHDDKHHRRRSTGPHFQQIEFDRAGRGHVWGLASLSRPLRPLPVRCSYVAATRRPERHPRRSLRQTASVGP